MSIILYQIGILIAIIISASYGKSSRNVAIILISIFTILQVYFSSIMLLQFFTIFISYYISKAIFPEIKKLKEKPKYIIEEHSNLKLREDELKEKELKRIELIKKGIIKENHISKLSSEEFVARAELNQKLSEQDDD
jgi:ABC-type transport system involved in multi-copper enzyme maturation permease subunit